MKRTVSEQEARASIGAVIERASCRGEDVVIEGDDGPVAVVLSPERYEAMAKAEEEQLWAAIEAVREANKDVPPEVIEAEVNAAFDEIRGKSRRADHE